jgi:hypothetical protein
MQEGFLSLARGASILVASSSSRLAQRRDEINNHQGEGVLLRSSVGRN